MNGPSAKRSGDIAHVSETALWVAMYRAMETDRPDALFRDPFARRLAGERGKEILRSVRFARLASSATIVRTKVYDEIVLRLVAEGVDEVLNLACGLDARAFRLPLPPALRWTDVDFPDMIAYRSGVLAGERPTCEYEAVGLDLADRAAREALFARVGARSRRVAVLSEGLLLYLPGEEVAALATALAARPSFVYWVADLNGPMALRMMTRAWGRNVKAGQARFLFAPAEGTKFFEPFGWHEIEYHSNWDASRRLKRGVWLYTIFGVVMALSTPTARERFRRGAGTAVLAKT